MPVRKFTVSPSVVRSLESVSKWIFLSNHECSRTLLFFSFACKFRVEKKFRCSFSHSFQNCAALFILYMCTDSKVFQLKFSTRLCPLFQGNGQYCVYITRLQSAISEFYWWKVIKAHNICTYITCTKKHTHTKSSVSPRQIGRKMFFSLCFQNEIVDNKNNYY